MDGHFPNGRVNEWILLLPIFNQYIVRISFGTQYIQYTRSINTALLI